MAVKGTGKVGKINAKIYVLILALLFLGKVAMGQQTEENIVLSDFTLPEYNKKTGDLEFIVYGKRAETLGLLLNLQGVKVDWIGETRKLTDIKAVVTTPSAVYDRVTKVIRGNEYVQFYSASMDVEGVGFDAEQEKQIIHIRNKVKVILREQLSAAEQTEDKKQKNNLE